MLLQRQLMNTIVQRGLLAKRTPFYGTLIYRQLHISPARLNNESTIPKVNKSESQVPPSSSKTTNTIKSEKVQDKTLWEKVVHEVHHYWDGTKLLGLECKISFKLALKSAAGYELTRRENKQLQRTTQDIVRLVPFSMFVIVPFAELLLPVALKLFPNLLPSTYESNEDKEKKRLRLRKTRQKISNTLRNTIQMKLPSTVTEEEKTDFKEFLVKLRAGLEPPTREHLLRLARLFKDDTVLDNLQRPQLIAVSKYINLQPIGTNQMLRFRIRNKLLNIKRDDRAIFYEGVDSLTTAELQSACGSRGIRYAGVSAAQLKHDLSLWLNLRLKEKIPSTLLVLSNAYTYGNLESHETLYDALQAVISSMPEEVYHIAEVDVVEEVSNKQRLELIKEQEELIESETKQEEGTIIQVQDKANLDDADTDADAEAPKEVNELTEDTSGAKEEGSVKQDETNKNTKS